MTSFLLVLSVFFLPQSLWAGKGCNERKCEKESSLTKKLTCTRCNQVSYCDQACQLADWPRHKGACNQYSRWVTKFKPKYFNQDSLRVEVRATGHDWDGLFAVDTFQAGEVIAYYWGDHLKSVPLLSWHPASADHEYLRVAGDRSDWIRTRPYLGAQFANDAIMDPSEGLYLLTMDPITEGKLNLEVVNRMVQYLVKYQQNFFKFVNTLNATLTQDPETQGWYLKAKKKILPGEEIGVSYEIRFWIQAVVSKLMLRGYYFEAIEFLRGVTLGLELQFKDSPRHLTVLSMGMAQDWITKSIFRSAMNTKDGKRYEILDRFIPLFGQPRAFVLTQWTGPFHESLLKTWSDRERLDKVNAYFWRDQLIMRISEEDIREMGKLVDLVQTRPASEFVRSDGSYQSHPEVIRFIKEHPVYFFELGQILGKVPVPIGSPEILKIMEASDL